MPLNKVKYEVGEETGGGCICDASGGMLYESHSLEHLSVLARVRLAEIHNNDDGIDYEAAEDILISEGLYTIGTVTGVMAMNKQRAQEE